MRPIRVLVVDDSAMARELLIAILSTDPDVCVVGEAADGQEALRKTQALQPDLITMDIEMPIMDGLEAIEQIMASHAVPILVVTNKDDADIAYRAISKGALELVEKPTIDLEDAKVFVAKVKLLSRVKVITHIRQRGRVASRQTSPTPPAGHSRGGDTVIAIAVSTGGPRALATLLPALPADFPWPIVIAQHMSDGFVRGMASWLNGLAHVSVKESTEHELLRGGTVYLAPSTHHMEIHGGGRVVFRERREQDIYHPSCDRLLTSVAHAYQERSVGIILTGMGHDGVLGMDHIKKAGGLTIAQDEGSCLLFGMPKVAIQHGCIDKILPLNDMSHELMRLV